MNRMNHAEENTRELSEFFHQLLQEEHERGVIGVASFTAVHDELMDAQKTKLREIVGSGFDSLYDSGSIISIAVAYRDPVIDYIDEEKNHSPDYPLWDRYAQEYDRLNQLLNRLAERIASRFDGIALEATMGGVIEDIEHVHEYFPMVISHRVVAEHAGIGWRGKNQLLIHERFSCAIRFASIITGVPLVHGTKMESRCGECTACEDVCGFIRHRDALPDYRENCRRYMLFLQSKGIKEDVCGKCIKACYRNSRFRDEFCL
ncbi:epoxyqueuosine reductase [Candidatus Thorarchaeota archaeon]|nr:MAG: epoxyqueuosine reductase [Candidatus Thorarchaeota archaeon]